MNHLILGSSGQVGNALKNFLNKKGQNVFEYDIANNKTEDLRSVRAAENLIKSSDMIYFLAFDVGGAHYLEKYQETFDFFHNNMLLQANTFETIKKYNKKFIYASSQMSEMAFSPYGLCKRIGEHYSKVLNGLVVKFWNVYGIEKDENKFHVISDFVKKAIEYQKIEMLTDGKEERQFLHADDCSNCLYTLANKYESINREENLHITSFKWTKIIDIANIISKSFQDVKVIPGCKTDNVQMSIRNEPDKNILKYWKPQIDLNEGIIDIIKQIKK